MITEATRIGLGVAVSIATTLSVGAYRFSQVETKQELSEQRLERFIEYFKAEKLKDESYKTELRILVQDVRDRGIRSEEALNIIKANVRQK